MSGGVTFVVYAEEPDVGEALGKLVEQNEHAEVVAIVNDEGLLRTVVEKEEPRFVLTDLGPAPHSMLDVLERLPKDPRLGSIVLGPENQSDVILRALKLGVREFLSDESPPEVLAELITTLAAEIAAEDTERPDSGVIVVMGAKGGVGATLAACQLASSLQRLGDSTAIVDLNMPLGDVAVYFDVQPTYTLADIAQRGVQIDATLVGELMHRHAPTGVQVLAAPSRVEQAELVNESHVIALIEQLRERFDWVVIDVSRSWSPTDMRAVDLADHLILMTLQDVPSLNHARAHRDLLLRLSVDAGKIHTIVNRAAKTAAVSSEDMAKFLGTSPEFSLPNDYATAVTSVNEGRPVADVAPGSALDTALQELASLVHVWHGLPPTTVKRKKLGKRILSMFERS
jgi:pilus assembly protein CpaE